MEISLTSLWHHVTHLLVMLFMMAVIITTSPGVKKSRVYVWSAHGKTSLSD